VQLTPTFLLEAWERAAPLAAHARPLALLALADGAVEPTDLALLPLGMRDERLLRVRRQLFGDRMTCTTVCPGCGGYLELDLCAGDFLGAAADAAEAVHRLDCDGYAVDFRTPNSTDLGALVLQGNGAEAEQQILARCVIDARGPSGPLDPRQLPPDLVAALEREIERRDPLAVIWLDLTCEHCGHAWRSLFDIASLLWIEIDRWARTLLQEVHQLAHAYGWAERDILQMSAVRRHGYLGMIWA